jgi:hypothetical protein
MSDKHDHEDAATKTTSDGDVAPKRTTTLLRAMKTTNDEQR